nr:TonB-dependent receptor [Flavobacterium sp.]
MRNNLLAASLLITSIIFAQEKQLTQAQKDSIKSQNEATINLKNVVVTPMQQSPERQPEVKGTVLFSGKKNEVLKLSSITANLTTNNAREVFSRVPGVTVWENDGSGIQINIGVRGLSPNRSWELNTRQNGYDISSDVFGYPEAYYNPPLEAVETIELVRGGASLQFGPQFGGMVNYVLKREDKKAFTFETQNTVGSYNLMSSYNAIGGKINKFSYYAYNHSRSADGWRDNGRYKVRNSHVFLEYAFTENTKLSAEYTNMDYAMQQSGGLTDDQFKSNSRQSFRERNWLGTPWNLVALNFDTKINDRLRSNTKVFGLLGERNSVGFVKTPDKADAISTTTFDYENRRVDRDFYKNYGIENRNIYQYKIGKTQNNVAFGARYYTAETQRQQIGKGTTKSDFDLTIEGKYERDLTFTTENIALFVENQFKVTPKFSVTPGVRYEYISSNGSGRFGVSSGSDVPFENKTITRNQPLFGIGMEYKMGSTNVYANITQAYRPVLFSDITPPAVTDVIDPNLKDASGYNADLGYRGTFKNYLNFDFSLFYLSYNNRIGNISQGTFIYRTNLGETVNKGIEGFVNLNVTRLFDVDALYGTIDVFATVSFIDSRYTDFEVNPTSGTVANLAGKRVENAPRYIHNFGISWSKNQFSTTLQYKTSGKIYTDALNTTTPSATGVIGLLEGYTVMDLSAEYKFLKNYNLRAGINNLTDETYATRRAGGYPGPGILPGEGRTFFISVGAKL